MTGVQTCALPIYTTICGGQVPIGVTTVGGVQPYTYHWSTGDTIPNLTVTPSLATTYSVVVSDVCLNSDSGQVLIGIGGTFANAGNDVTTCLGNPVTLTASGGTQYHWSTGENTQSISVNPIANTTYIVSVTTLCTDVDSVTVFVNPLPNITASASPDSICAGIPSSLSFMGGNVITWSSNPVDPTLASQANSPNPIVRPSYSTTYTIIAKDSNNCENTATTNIVVFPQPLASFIATPNPVLVSNTNVFFSNTSSGNSPILIWDLGDGTSSDLQQFSHQFPNQDSGRYVVTLIVTNSFGCADTTTRTVVVQPDYSIYIPSAFSPNGDGVNESFFVSGVNIHDFHLQIFNRWGMQLFDSIELSLGWDGNYLGKEVPEGIYVYRVSYTDPQNIKHLENGTVTIIK